VKRAGAEGTFFFPDPAITTPMEPRDLNTCNARSLKKKEGKTCEISVHCRGSCMSPPPAIQLAFYTVAATNTAFQLIVRAGLYSFSSVQLRLDQYAVQERRPKN
jgi:hypothetical protein